MWEILLKHADEEVQHAELKDQLKTMLSEGFEREVGQVGLCFCTHG